MATAITRGHASNGAVPEDVRRHNRGLVLDLLSRFGVLPRRDIAARTGLTEAAISRISRELLDIGLVTEQPALAEPSGRGRPAVALELAPAGGFVVGVGIGAYEQSIQVANLRGSALAVRPVELLDRTPARSITALAREIRSLIAEIRVPDSRILGVGVAVAGLVNPEEGIVVRSPNIGWENIPLASRLKTALRLPVAVEAMHHALNLAEAREGATRGITDAVLVNVAMGIGASLMEEGRIVRGSHAAAGQIGHMHVAGANELCTCGRRGCLDTVASGYAVLRRLGAVAPRRAPKEHGKAASRRLLAAMERERRGDSTARAAFRACGTALGDALNGLRMVLDPARIVLAGPLAHIPSYVDAVRQQLEDSVLLTPGQHSPFIYLATHSNDSAGAALALGKFVLSGGVDLGRLRA